MLATRMRASGGGPPDRLLPWLINIDGFMTAVSHTNFDTITVDTDTVYNAVKSSSGAQNDEINFDIVLAAGTWTFELIHRQDASHGIYTVKFDSTTVGTIDAYNGVSLTENVRSQITGITVSSTGKVRLKLQIASKNASSSGYDAAFQHIQLKRTA